MSINWLVTVPTPQGVSIPTYGNYGGPGFSDGRIVRPGEVSPLTTPPTDPLDALFREHDRAYSTSADVLVLARADLQLLRGIVALPDSQLSGEGHLYAGSTELALIEQINGRYRHPEVFSPGEQSVIDRDALDNLEQGRLNPDLGEIGAVQEQLSNLVRYAQGASTSVDVLEANPLLREGRDATPFFSTAGYLSANPDVRAAGVNPLTHYNQFGAAEGRDPSLNFDNEAYLRANPDVRAAGVNPLAHFLAAGQVEGRQSFMASGTRADVADNGFDREYYLLANSDVGFAGVDAQTHYNRNGVGEGRNPNAFFDTAAYLNTYSDVRAAGVNPLDHYHNFGFREGRDPSTRFDTSQYLAANPDVRAAGIDPLFHFLEFGRTEGRATFDDGTLLA